MSKTAPGPQTHTSLRRIDVLSIKGGVGKTTLSYLVARAQASHSGRPVLIVDADLSGTCLGDLLDETEDAWSHVSNLAHLICGAPESLAEQLTPDALPVYLHDPGRKLGTPAVRVGETDKVAGQILYCPSHADSTLPWPVDRQVLQALVGHETAGGWVRHVIDRVIGATAQVTGGLGGVIVDHAPGISALHSQILDDIRVASPAERRVLMVTTGDRVDLKMTNDFYARTAHSLDGAAHWVINRASTHWSDDETFRDAQWFQRLVPISFDDGLRLAYMEARLFAPGAAANIENAVKALRSALFGDPTR